MVVVYLIIAALFLFIALAVIDRISALDNLKTSVKKGRQQIEELDKQVDKMYQDSLDMEDSIVRIHNISVKILNYFER